MNYAPVALFVYNRPWHTRQAVESLLANPLAGETDLYIFSDAPRSETASQNVQEVREYIRQVSGFKSVTIIERENNWGLARSIIDGVTMLCSRNGRVIVLEDDLVVSPAFLRFMNDALVRYVDEERVMQVAGYMFPVQLENTSEDALFLPLTSSWGWATWDRAWKFFDAEAQGFEVLRKDSAVRKAFNAQGRYNYFGMLESQRAGKTDSWAIRWYLSVFVRHGLVLYPRQTLVQNLGFDGSGVHCAARDMKGQSISRDFNVHQFPSEVTLSAECDVVLNSIPKPKISLNALFNIIKKRILGAK